MIQRMLNVFLLVSNCFKHFFKICQHKYYVSKYCFKARLYWRGLTHDLSKFNPIEFWESVRYYNGKRSPIDICKEKNGYSKAWLHHKGANDHHYEYWQDNFDSGTTHIEMPYKAFAEMICDWFGAGKAYNGSKFSPLNESQWWWYNKRPKALSINSKTLERIDKVMTQLEKSNSFDYVCKNLKKFYYEN